MLAEQIEREVVRQLVEVDRFGVRLETTDKKALRLVADIHVAVMGAENWHASIDAVEGLGDQGVVFAGVAERKRPPFVQSRATRAHRTVRPRRIG